MGSLPSLHNLSRCRLQPTPIVIPKKLSGKKYEVSKEIDIRIAQKCPTQLQGVPWSQDSKENQYGID